VTDPTRALRITALAVCAIWVPIIVVWAHTPFTVTFDDAFYYFQIGKELRGMMPWISAGKQSVTDVSGGADA